MTQILTDSKDFWLQTYWQRETRWKF